MSPIIVKAFFLFEYADPCVALEQNAYDFMVAAQINRK